MGNNTRKYILLGTILGIGLLGILSAILFLPQAPSAKQPTAKAGTIGACLRSGATQLNMVTASSTTTPVFLTTGLASSTLSFETDGLTALNVSLQYSATQTTRSFLQVDRFSSDNNVDFFAYDNTKGLTSNVIASTSPSLTWIPTTTTGTSTIVAKLDLIPARYTKLVFSLGTTTAKTVNDTIGFYANVVGSYCSN